jgi:hypothetical protein
MQRPDLTLDEQTVRLLEQLAERYFQGDLAVAVREALVCLAARLAESGAPPLPAEPPAKVPPPDRHA